MSSTGGGVVSMPESLDRSSSSPTCSKPRRLCEEDDGRRVAECRVVTGGGDGSGGPSSPQRTERDLYADVSLAGDVGRELGLEGGMSAWLCRRVVESAIPDEYEAGCWPTVKARWRPPLFAVCVKPHRLRPSGRLKMESIMSFAECSVLSEAPKSPPGSACAVEAEGG